VFNDGYLLCAIPITNDITREYIRSSRKFLSYYTFLNHIYRDIKRLPNYYLVDGFALSKEEGSQINFRGTKMVVKVSE
jgi:hypothetical protein